MWETLQLKPTVSSSWDGVTAPFCGEFGDGSLLLGLPHNMSCGLNVLHGGTKHCCCLRFSYARTSFAYARSSTLRRPYA